MRDSPLYHQTRLREHLRNVPDSRLLSLEIIVTNRLADIKRFVDWKALEQSYARDLRAIHDEMKFRERLKVHGNRTHDNR